MVNSADFRKKLKATGRLRVPGCGLSPPLVDLRAMACAE
jgi:hypothetical protein